MLVHYLLFHGNDEIRNTQVFTNSGSLHCIGIFLMQFLAQIVCHFLFLTYADLISWKIQRFLNEDHGILPVQ